MTTSSKKWQIQLEKLYVLASTDDAGWTLAPKIAEEHAKALQELLRRHENLLDALKGLEGILVCSEGEGPNYHACGMCSVCEANDALEANK